MNKVFYDVLDELKKNNSPFVEIYGFQLRLLETAKNPSKKNRLQGITRYLSKFYNRPALMYACYKVDEKYSISNTYSVIFMNDVEGFGLEIVESGKLDFKHNDSRYFYPEMKDIIKMFNVEYKPFKVDYKELNYIIKTENYIGINETWGIDAKYLKNIIDILGVNDCECFESEKFTKIENKKTGEYAYLLNVRNWRNLKNEIHN